jgi:hypothetical protein
MFKVYYEKVYNSIEWEYFEGIYFKDGFSKQVEVVDRGVC